MVPYAGTSINRQLRQSGRLKGTLAAPDYGYLDPRLELFQVFLSQAFHFRNFDGKDLAERLRFAKLDVAVVRKFCSEQYEGGSYAAALGELIRRSNEEALEKMSMAARFMEERTEAQIIDKWPYIDLLVHEEKAAERQLTTELDWLMVLFGFEAEVPRIAPVVA